MTRVPREPQVLLRRTTTPVAVAKVNVDAGRGLTFNIGAVPGVSDFSSMWKYYKILSVKLTYELRTPNISGNIPFPRVWHAFDNGDSSTPLTVDVITAYHDSKHFQFGTSRVTFSRTFKPEPLITVGGQTGLLAEGSRWINTNSQTIPHYAVREWIENYNTISTPNTLIDFIVEYTIAVKGVR